MDSKQRQYASVSDLVRAVAPDADFLTAVEERLAGRRLIKQLLSMRAVKGLSQQDIAEKLHCTQSRISKMESSVDDDLRLGDLRAYAKAVDCSFVAGVLSDEVQPVDRVKGHVFAIKKHMDDLARLAQSDEEIVQGVAGFFFELFVNFSRLLGDSAKLLPLRPDESPYFDCELEIAQVGHRQRETQELISCVDTDDPMLVAP
jgi:transcriptional regulator with XRE-family HTH domain